jgi:hypothetical protein
MNKYTQEGTEVIVVKEINEGYLCKIIYGYYNDDDDDESEITSDQIVFIEKLFDQPPREKFEKGIQELLKEKSRIEEEIFQLKKTKEAEHGLLSRVSKYPIVEQLTNYLTGDFEYILFLSNCKIEKKDSVYNSQYVRMANCTTTPFALYKLHNEYWPDGGSDDVPFLVFKTMDEAQKEAKRRILERLNKFNGNYNKSVNFKEILDKTDSSCLAKKDTDVLALFNSKYSVFKAEENKEKAEKLKEEIEKIEKKKKELESLEANNPQGNNP